MTDAIYVATLISITPATRYIRLSSGGIEIKAPDTVSIESPSVSIEADSIELTSTTLTHNGVNIGYLHTHIGVESGDGTSGPPTP